MKKILFLFGLILCFAAARGQTPYDTVNVYDPQNFTEMTTIDPANGQIISRKNSLNRRIHLDTLRNYMTPAVVHAWLADPLDSTNVLSTYWRQFVTDSLGVVWYVDADGDAKKISNTNGVSNGDKGDITVTSLGTVWNIDAGVVGANEIASTAVTPGSYTATNITVDADGRITSAATSATIYTANDTLESARTVHMNSNGMNFFDTQTGTSDFQVYLDNGTDDSDFYIEQGYLTYIAGDNSDDVFAGLNIQSYSNGDNWLYISDNAGANDTTTLLHQDDTGTFIGTIVDASPFGTGGIANPTAVLDIYNEAGENETMRIRGLDIDNAADSVLVITGTGYVGLVHKDSLAGGADGNGLITALPAGDVTIDANGNALYVDTLSYWGFFLADGVSGVSGDVSGNNYTIEIGSKSLSGSMLAILVDTTSVKVKSDNAQIEWEVSDTKASYSVDTLDATGVTTFLGFPTGTDTDNQTIDTFTIVSNTLRLSLQDDAQAFKSVSLASYLDNTDAQTLSSSRDSITISTGNTIRTPAVAFLRDSITGAALTINLKTYGEAIIEIRMESCTATTLTVTNSWSSTDIDNTYPTFEGESGVYTFHFNSGSAMNDQITWPADFLDMGGTALGTDTLLGPTSYTCYKNPVTGKFYCR